MTLNLNFNDFHNIKDNQREKINKVPTKGCRGIRIQMRFLFATFFTLSQWNHFRVWYKFEQIFFFTIKRKKKKFHFAMS